MWTLNGTRIFVQEHSGDASQIIPRLQPLNGRTVLQFFGYEDTVVTLSAIIVGDADKYALLDLRKTATAYTLESPMGNLGTYYVKKVSFKQMPNICQTLRTDLDSDAPMYTMDMELYPTSDI